MGAFAALGLTTFSLFLHQSGALALVAFLRRRNAAR